MPKKSQPVAEVAAPYLIPSTRPATIGATPDVVPPVAAPDRLLSCEEVAALLSVGRTWLLTEVREGRFARPIKLGRSTRWLASEVQNYIAGQVAAQRA